MRPLRRHGIGAAGQFRFGRGREPPDEADERDEADELELGRLGATDRTLDDPDDDRAGARYDDDERPDDGALRMEEGERRYGVLDPMVRLGRIGEVRGTMTGRDELTEEPGRPPPTRGETGCRTKGDDEERVLGRDDGCRALGRDDAPRVVGSRPPLEPMALGLVDDEPLRRPRDPALGSIRGRAPLPLDEGIRPGR
jgi:hypothetical protein